MVKPKHVGKWPCPTPGCGKEFVHKQSLQNHRKVCANERISCPTCKKTVYRKSYLKHHVCATKPTTICLVCGKDFKKKYFLDRHMKTHTKEAKVHECNKCGATYKRKDHFDAHVSKCTQTIRKKSNIDDSFLPTMIETDIWTNTNNYDILKPGPSTQQHQDDPTSPIHINHSQADYDFVLEPVDISSEPVGDAVDTVADNLEAVGEEPEPMVYILDDIVNFTDEVHDVGQETTHQVDNCVLSVSLINSPRFWRKVS